MACFLVAPKKEGRPPKDLLEEGKYYQGTHWLGDPHDRIYGCCHTSVDTPGVIMESHHVLFVIRVPRRWCSSFSATTR